MTKYLLGAMTIKYLISLILLSTVCLISCESSALVAISNETATDRRIKVIYPPKFMFPGEAIGRGQTGKRDSIETYDLELEDIYQGRKFIPFISRDTVARTYSFVLKANQRAIVESRFLAYTPTYKQIFIIDDVDTIKLVRFGKHFERRPKLMLGGTWEYYITDGQPPKRRAYHQPVKQKEPDHLGEILDILGEGISNASKQ
ncbi:hypothetical protein L3C95_30165 [Chitinophaga filiformis]|uniref:hypothetical protein n=1 Tax=Chitinophaga filiformis TaxID=104663 RepID=UPI001F307F85|nr:hypothetical protein [Chitinophaga filiformis]MCF6407200.1 hypothetical protein [Chitinophaga filiformis]